MTRRIRRKRLLIVGGIPPPFGGVTVHIQRLARLARAEGYDVRVADIHRARPERTPDGLDILPLAAIPNLPRIALACLRADVVHVHSAGTGGYAKELGLLLLSRLGGARAILTLHGGNLPPHLATLRGARRAIARAALRLAHRVITVSETQRVAIETHISAFVGRRALVTPAYLPSAEIIPPSAPPPPVILLAVGGWIPAYGFDVLLKAIARLPPDVPAWHLRLVPYSMEGEDENLRRAAEALLAEASIRARCSFEVPTPDLRVLFGGVHVYVRPTRTDGDSVIVREALDAGIHVAASDCEDRPPGTVRFRSGDPEDLARVLGEVIARAAAGAPAPRSPPSAFGQRVLAAYEG